MPDQPTASDVTTTPVARQIMEHFTEAHEADLAFDIAGKGQRWDSEIPKYLDMIAEHRSRYLSDMALELVPAAVQSMWAVAGAMETRDAERPSHTYGVDRAADRTAGNEAAEIVMTMHNAIDAHYRTNYVGSLSWADWDLWQRAIDGCYRAPAEAVRDAWDNDVELS